MQKTLNVSYTDEEGNALKPTLEEQETIRYVGHIKANH